MEVAVFATRIDPCRQLAEECLIQIASGELSRNLLWIDADDTRLDPHKLSSRAGDCASQVPRSETSKRYPSHGDGLRDICGYHAVRHVDAQALKARHGRRYVGIDYSGAEIIRSHAAGVYFWPFDGWDIPEERSVLAEVYPSLWSSGFARENRSDDQHDAYSAAEWMRRADRDGTLMEFFSPVLSPQEREVAHIEGWILAIK